MGELKPCPFCGDDNLGHAADCYMALCKLPDLPSPAVMEAAWNRRTPQPVTPAGGEVVGEVFVSERGYHSQIHDSVAHLPVGRHPLYIRPTVAGDVEPVAWQFRVQVGGSWLRWMPCTENLFDEIVEFGENRYRPAQARPLYTNPPNTDAAPVGSQPVRARPKSDCSKLIESGAVSGETINKARVFLDTYAMDRKDAERYRWLRDECPEAFAMTLVMRRESEEWAAEIDRVVDAALNQRGGGV